MLSGRRAPREGAVLTDSDDFSRRRAELSQIVLCDDNLDGFLRRVTDLSVALIPSCDSCSVSVASDGKVCTRASSDAVSKQLDQHQYDTDNGPCLEAISTGKSIRSDDLAVEARWPGFTSLAASEGVTGCYSVPLRVGENTIGALNLYGLTKPFGEDDQDVAEAFGAQAAVAVATPWPITMPVS